MKKFVQNFIYTFIMVIMPISTVLADEEFLDDVDDITPSTPVDHYLLLAIMAALILAFYYKQTKQLATNK